MPLRVNSGFGRVCETNQFSWIALLRYLMSGDFSGENLFFTQKKNESIYNRKCIGLFRSFCYF